MSAETRCLAALPGLITHEQGMLLAELAAAVPAGSPIVEIGSYRGKSTCYLAYGARRAGAHVYAVDPWDLPGNVSGKHGYADEETWEAFKLNVISMGYVFDVTPIKAFSVDAAGTWRGRKIRLLYIDGDHSEAAVRADFWIWRWHLARSCVVAFDDLDTPKNPGVRAVVDEIIESGAFRSFEQRGRLGIFRR